MPFWPAPQRINRDPLSGVNFIGAGNIKLDDDQRFVRIDHNFSEQRQDLRAVRLRRHLVLHAAGR